VKNKKAASPRTEKSHSLVNDPAVTPAISGGISLAQSSLRRIIA
jgi:hypothetical protein